MPRGEGRSLRQLFLCGRDLYELYAAAGRITLSGPLAKDAAVQLTGGVAPNFCCICAKLCAAISLAFSSVIL